jgi:micrococcal nuclease
MSAAAGLCHQQRGEPLRWLTGPVGAVEPCGSEASAANRRLAEGKTVHLELDVRPWDRYQRLLAYVYVGDLLVTAELVRQGDAPVATYPPNVTSAEHFRQRQGDARQVGQGAERHPRRPYEQPQL